MRKKGLELVFHGELPDGEEVIDFYDAAGHLKTALAAVYGDTHPKRRAQIEKQRHVLLEDYKGVEKVIRSLAHLRDTCPRRKKIARELKYFRRNRHRMRYAALKEQGLPIGSGVTEAACKTLSNATHEEVRNAMGRARRPSHSILPRSRAEQSLRASLDPARTYLRQTMRIRLQSKLREIKIELKRRLHHPVPEVGQWLRSVMQGHFNYYAVPRNQRKLGAFKYQVYRLWLRTLRQRSQRLRMTGERMNRLADRWFPPIRILHPYPEQRLRVMT